MSELSCAHRTGGVDPPDRTAQLSVHTPPLIRTQPGASAAAAGTAQRSRRLDSAAALAVSVAETESGSGSSSDAGDDAAHEPYSPPAAAQRRSGPVSSLTQLELEADDKAARRAFHLIATHHAHRTAQTLYSTASMADLAAGCAGNAAVAASCAACWLGGAARAAD